MSVSALNLSCPWETRRCKCRVESTVCFSARNWSYPSKIAWNSRWIKDQSGFLTKTTTNTYQGSIDHECAWELSIKMYYWLSTVRMRGVKLKFSGRLLKQVVQAKCPSAASFVLLWGGVSLFCLFSKSYNSSWSPALPEFEGNLQYSLQIAMGHFNQQTKAPVVQVQNKRWMNAIVVSKLLSFLLFLVCNEKLIGPLTNWSVKIQTTCGVSKISVF